MGKLGYKIQLLIVPYGIETRFMSAACTSCALLIVPYGIETLLFVVVEHGQGDLLIVPYGIETNHLHQLTPAVSTFNRTLWN